MFLVNDTDGGEILNFDNLEWLFGIEDNISKLMTPKNGLTLDDVCFKPTGDACVVQSGYFELTVSPWSKLLPHTSHS